ncbi:MAG: hypothetical protein K2F65_05810 [Eubacterium sp.]|nr:hypothetical protein [Eubacterium sp.]
MIFIWFVSLGILFTGLNPNYEASCIVNILSSIVFFAFIAHIFTLTLAVGRSAKRKGLASGWIWTIFTFIFGIPTAIIFALFTSGIDDNENKKVKNNSAIMTTISLVLLSAYIIGMIGTGMYSSNYMATHFTLDDTFYVTEDGREVIYDKKGIAYTRIQEDSFKYYSRDGKTYVPILYYDIFATEPDVQGYNCIEEGKTYDEFEYDFAIDCDGYFLIFPNDNLEFSMGDLYDYYDKNGNVYFNPESCYWTPEGELSFDTKNLDKMTYQDVLEYEEKFDNEEY